MRAADAIGSDPRGIRRFVLVSLFAAVLFFVNLGAYDLWPPDEPRFGEVAREMLLSGDPVVLRINGVFYKEKPPLLFWLICLFSLPFGEVTAAAARTPSALAGVATVILTMALARRLGNARTAWTSGVVLATCALFFWEARSVRTDMLLTAFLTAALFAFQRWDETRDGRWRLLFFAAISGGLLAKGPPGLVFPLLLVYTYYWGRREERRRLHVLPGVVLAAVPAATWFVLANLLRGDVPVSAADLGETGMADNLFRQTVGRFFLGVSKAEWPWYYVVEVLPTGLLPWTLFLPWTLVWAWRRRRDPALRLLLCGSVPAFLFFTLSIGKRPVYILPLFPIFAILVAQSVLDLMDGPGRRWRRNTGIAWAVLMALAGAAPLGLLLSEHRASWTPALLAITAAGFAFAVDALRRVLRTEARDLHKAVALHFSILAVLATAVVFPVLNEHKSARSLTEPLRLLSRQGVEYRLYSVGFSREEYVFYSEHFHTPVLTEPLPLDLEEDLDPVDEARLQKDLNDVLVEAVEDVPVADFAAMTPSEIEALRDAIETALDEADVGPGRARAFERALSDAIRRFADDFEAPGPAYFFVEERDWRWLTALYPHLTDYAVVQHEPVGSREVLLLANDAGAELLAGWPPSTVPAAPR